MQTLILVSTLVLFPIALFTLAKALYHWWFVVAGVRRDKVITATFLGPILLLFPSWLEGLLEEKAQYHLRRLSPWLLTAIVSLVFLIGLRALGEHLS